MALSGQWTRSISGRDIDIVAVPGAYSPLGRCMLRREFDWNGDQGRVFLCTEGVLASATFVVNGRELGTAGPWAPYRFEIPRGWLKSRNTIEAHVTDMLESFGPTPGRRFNGGLVRDIYLETRPATFIESICFRAELNDELNPARCTVAVELDGPQVGESRVTLVDRTARQTVASLSAGAGQAAVFEVQRPRLWSPQSPALYTLTVELPNGDRAVEQVGFRRITTRGPDFYLNGQRLVLRGVCRHEFNAESGYSPSEAEVRRELAMIRHVGFNYVRLVHSPQAPCVVRIAAELGLLVSAEPGTCFHDLGDEQVIAPAVECMRRIVKRDRNVPSILAWLIYNECNPNTDYAVRIARTLREIDLGCRLGFADCSGQNENILAMARAADLTFYGINVYNPAPKAYIEKMNVFTDRPLVFTEWGGVTAQGNPRALKTLCDSFVRHTRPEASPRMAGCSFWAWADYEEYSRAEPAAIDGWTIEGLVDRDGAPKGDLLTLSMMCFEMEHGPAERRPTVQILLERARREEAWNPVDLRPVGERQVELESLVEQSRSRYRQRPPALGSVLVDGIEFACRQRPVLLGGEGARVTIPVGQMVSAIAVLGQAALIGGYPASTIWSVHHRDAEVHKRFGDEASQYELIFDDGSLSIPLRHGIELLRGNEICRWWKTAPRSPAVRPAVRITVHPSYEILRLGLYELALDRPRHLREIRWRTSDSQTVQAIWALSVRSPARS